MAAIWYSNLSFMLMMYVVLEGYDIGAGMLQYIVGKTDAERRTVVAAIGPLWSWHEVWLLGFGGTLLLAFPAVMTSVLSGFYLAIFLLIWALVLRGVSIELSGHIEDALWRSAWDFCFVASNTLLAILLGAALGNVLRGVSLDAQGNFALPLFTDFRPKGRVGILDWYTLSVALFMLSTFAAHGASGLAKRTSGLVHDRSIRLATRLWQVVIVLLAFVSVETWLVRPEFFAAMLHQPFGWLGILFVVAGLSTVRAGIKSKNDARALAGSAVFIAGLMIAGAAGVYPSMLRSTTIPDYSLSVYRTAADTHGLFIAIVWWPIALVFASGYFWFIHRNYRGKVRPATDVRTPY